MAKDAEWRHSRICLLYKKHSPFASDNPIVESRRPVLADHAHVLLAWFVLLGFRPWRGRHAQIESLGVRGCGWVPAPRRVTCWVPAHSGKGGVTVFVSWWGTGLGGGGSRWEARWLAVDGEEGLGWLRGNISENQKIKMVYVSRCL